ncbi:MAG: universal stress protein [Rhodospirillales bacterium]|nr:universal stress protein [Rhodospirillales bacterium]
MNPILVASDLSPRSELAFARAVQLAQGSGGSVRVLFVVDDALPGPVARRLEREGLDHIRRQLLPQATAAQVEATVAVRHGRASDAILAEAEAIDAGLILLGIHRQDEKRDLFLGSTAWRVLRDSQRPVLQVKHPVAGPYRRVLVAIDLTPAAEAALGLACRLSAAAEFSAVHAFRVPFVGALPTYEELRETAERHRAAIEQRIADALRSLSTEGVERPVAVHAQVQPGDVIEVIRRECDRVKPDLLVVATRGRVGVEDAFYKSIAESLLRGPPCDIAAVAADGARG